MDIRVNIVPAVQYMDTDLISDEHQSELIGLANADRLIAFRVGDIAIEEIEDKARRGIAVSHDRIDEAVGRFHGKTGRTIRYYRETAAFFDMEARSAYDMLPFSFFVFARSMGERWQEVLDYASTNAHIRLEGLRIAFLGLRVASTNGQVASGFRAGVSEQETRESDLEMPGYAVAPIKTGEVSSRIPSGAVAHADLTVVNAFAASCPKVREIILASDLTPTCKIALLTALKSIENILPQLIKAIARHK